MSLYLEILCKIILMGDEGKLLSSEEALQKTCLQFDAGLQTMSPEGRLGWSPALNIMSHHSCFFNEHCKL